MSDLYGPAEPTDRVHETLTALRTDLDRAPLSDVRDVRRRGQQRARHQTVGVVAAAAAVVAIVVGGSLGLTGNDKATSELPANQARTLATDPFLRVTDVGQVGPYESLQRSPDPVDESQRPLRCLPSPTTLGATETKSTLFFSDLDARFTEHVLRYADAAAARRGTRALSAAFETCTEQAGPGVTDVGPTTGAGSGEVDEVVNAARTVTPQVDGEVFYYELGAARVDNVVVVLQWTSQGSPFDDPSRFVWTPDLLDTAAARAIG